MTFGDQQSNGVGELDLASDSVVDPPQRVEDRPVQDVPAGSGVERRRIVRLGFFDHALTRMTFRIIGVGQSLDVEDAVRADLVARNLDRAQHRCHRAWRGP